MIRHRQHGLHPDAVWATYVVALILSGLATVVLFAIHDPRCSLTAFGLVVFATCFIVDGILSAERDRYG